ncbi:MAG: thioredoxin domain-containing protein [Candidatus Binatia bacterium]
MRDRLKKALPVIILAVIGLGVSVTIEALHRKLATDVNYTSFCNVSARVNCDVVLGSRYASLAGFSVATWAILYYLGILGLAGGGVAARRASMRATLAALAFASAVWGVLFSIYMAVIAFAVLHAVCMMCGTLYLVNVGLFGTAWRLRSALRVGRRRQAARRSGQDQLVFASSLIVALALVGLGSWEALGRGGQLATAAAIQRQRPDFYRWYFARPVAQLPADTGRNARGDPNAPVTIVEFSDFECGHCAAFHKSLEEVLHRVGRDVRVVFRHFPLDRSCNPGVPTRVHPEACLAAVASECAAEQGKFWQFQDLLFTHQRQLGRAFLLQYAARVGLDVPRFTGCLGSSTARARVERDAQEGAELGIDSTPTIFINGRRIKGALDPELLRSAVTLARAGH